MVMPRLVARIRILQCPRFGLCRPCEHLKREVQGHHLWLVAHLDTGTSLTRKLRKEVTPMAA